MKIDITRPPEPDIFRDRRKYILWFSLFMMLVVVSILIGVFAVYSASRPGSIEDWALGILVGASLGITWSGNRLQAYKKLLPPQVGQLEELRAKHPAIELYCAGAESSGRRLVRAEFEACLAYAEDHAAAPFI